MHPKKLEINNAETVLMEFHPQEPPSTSSNHAKLPPLLALWCQPQQCKLTKSHILFIKNSIHKYKLDKTKGYKYSAIKSVRYKKWSKNNCIKSDLKHAVYVICVGNKDLLIEPWWIIHTSMYWVIFGSGNGLSPVLLQAITWNNGDFLSIDKIFFWAH